MWAKPAAGKSCETSPSFGFAAGKINVACHIATWGTRLADPVRNYRGLRTGGSIELTAQPKAKGLIKSFHGSFGGLAEAITDE
jgi:hypothetical protein